MKKFKRDTPAGQLLELLSSIEDSEEAVAQYAVVEKSDDRRVTMGVMYAPGTLDAHGEFVNSDDLEDAVYGYMENGDLEVRKQHGEEVIGRVVGIISWPFEQEVTLKPVSGVEKEAKTVTLPAGTVYATARWTKEAWPLVKSGKIRGFSMGGGAVRVRNEPDDGLRKIT